MTYVKNLLGSESFKDFDRYFVGYDNWLNQLTALQDDVSKNVSNYPPYNIKRFDDTKYLIELAVAGFARAELDISFENSKLTVTGKSTADTTADYLFKGIGLRDFTRTFVLNEQIQVLGADLQNGLLQISLERIVPDHQKPKKIQINTEQTLLENAVD